MLLEFEARYRGRGARLHGTQCALFSACALLAHIEKSLWRFPIAQPVDIMRTLLRDPASGQYFESLERWTPFRDRAHDFGLIERAVNFAHKAHFADMELVVALEGTEADPALPFGRLRFKHSDRRCG